MARQEQARLECGVRSWVRGNLLGAGAFGTVNLALNRQNATLFAVKSAEYSSVGAEADYLAIKNEQEILQSLESPFIISFLGIDISMENNKPMYNMFLEYMPGGSLADLMKKFGGCLDEHLIRVYTRGILQGLEYIHGQGIVHCDIKGKNVLVGASGIKLADFGAAKRLDSISKCPSMMRGTPLWMSPEVARQEEQGTASDIWSLGCTVVEMAIGRAPWTSLHSSNNPLVALYHIACSNETPEIPPALSAEGKDFLARCFRRIPTERWTSAQLLQHPFVTNTLPLEEPLPPRPLSPTSALDRFWDLERTSKTTIMKPLPVDVLQRSSFGGDGELDRDRECEITSVMNPSVCGYCESDLSTPAPCREEEHPKAGGGQSWWSSSPSSLPSGKWIVVHSPKSSLQSSELPYIFSEFIAQSQLHFSDPCGSSSADEQSTSIPQQQEDEDAVRELNIDPSVSAVTLGNCAGPTIPAGSHTLSER